MIDPIKEYAARHQQFLKTVAESLRMLITDYISGTPNVERVTARAKDPQRFALKAQTRDDKGKPKYKKPLTEIQDQIGARIIVFYRQDVPVISEVIRRYFQPIEQKELVPENEWAFGYFGQHFMLPMPKDVIPRDVDAETVPHFFELQIKTLFQHAWSEAEHDLSYKRNVRLSPDQLRRLAFTAAQAWGADHIFSELVAELQTLKVNE